MSRALDHADRVYPRVCGGTGDFRYAERGTAGLSPRVRGNPWRQPARTGRTGSIPACAGEPLVGPHIVHVGEVYPRVCGGTLFVVAGVVSRTGLSPRVRGNPSHKNRQRSSMRSIPACAGEPPGGPSHYRNRRVYPRVCGGTVLGSALPSVLVGLSPRVRGNRRWF